ncbi:ATP-binding protein [Mesorhizobium sp.]|uniref:ATP-binding protein n=1 Tax=Mesorhizobium sp. TaxID=1871066 RepID=UPI0025DE292B|nr:ATP-binding protein [Mesorhizobium sp.]
MAEIHYQVKVEKDHIRKLAAAKPVPAIAELIWNGLDADATRVDLEFDEGEAVTEAIIVSDNGHGIPYADVETLFGKLGGSWKAHGNRSKGRARLLHGKEGKGRFKALALGRVADWTSVFRAEDQNKYRFTISVIRDDLVDVRVTAPTRVENSMPTGVEVRITELDRSYRSLEPDQSVQPLSEIFALYLTDYRDVSIYVASQKLDPDSLIKVRTSFDLQPIIDEGAEFSASVEVIEWTSATERWIFLCGPEGFPFHRVSPGFQTPGHQFSAYIKSQFIQKLQEQSLMDFVEMNAPLQKALEEAGERIKLFFRERDSEVALSEIERWKAEEVYPYAEPPQTSVEVAEQQLFNIVALNVNKHVPDFSSMDRRNKAFQLRMLRHALEKGPNELQHIFSEVLGLPERKQKELSKLLMEADLGNIITASRLVSDRMKFLTGLEMLIYDPETKKYLKERSQLHRMIADNNTWIFGEEFSLTVDDQSLTEVLRKHRKLIGDEIVIDTPVKRIDEKTGIVDLMLSRSVPQSRPDEREHLVIELKRPSQPIGADEIMQVKKYAYTVAADERFRHLKTRWSFWVISNELDPFARIETRQKDKPRGQVSQTDDGAVEVWVKSWSEVLADSKGRMRFVQDKLQANVDKDHALAFLRTTYDRYLSSLPEPTSAESEEDEDAAAE